MTRPVQKRLLGILALFALGFHGAVELDHHHDDAAEPECVVCAVQQPTVLAVGPDPFESRLSIPEGAVTEEAPPIAQQTSLACRTSRGPPV